MSSMLQATEKIWMNGSFVNWDDAKVHILTHSLHYGTGVFEGIRCYKTDSGPAVFRLQEHVDRLFDSSHILHICRSRSRARSWLRQSLKPSV